MEYDLATVQEFKAGHADAFERIMRAEGSALLYFIKRQLRHAEHVDDVFQDACYRIWRSRETLIDPTKIRSWMFQVSRSAVLDFLKKRDWSLSIEMADEAGEPFHFFDDSPDPRLQAARSEIQGLLNAEIDNLEDKAKEIFLLRFASDLKLREISESLNISMATVKYSLSGSLKKIRQRLNVLGVEIKSYLS